MYLNLLEIELLLNLILNQIFQNAKNSQKKIYVSSNCDEIYYSLGQWLSIQEIYLCRIMKMSNLRGTIFLHLNSLS